MAEYNLSEFRANTRKAFDEAERGEPVYIERYGEDFILMSKKNWNDTMSLHNRGVNTLITDDVSSDIKPDLPQNMEFASDGTVRPRVGYAKLGDKVFVANGVDPVKKIDLTKKNNSDPQADELPGVDSL